jgi:hypothetical protein
MPNLEILFPEKEQKTEAIEHFRALKDNPDWIFLKEKLIQADIDDITAKLLDPKREWRDGEEKENKRIRAYWLIIKELPEELIVALTENKADIFDNSDPYYQSVEEMKEEKV